MTNKEAYDLLNGSMDMYLHLMKDLARETFTVNDRQHIVETCEKIWECMEKVKCWAKWICNDNRSRDSKS